MNARLNKETPHAVLQLDPDTVPCPDFNVCFYEDFNVNFRDDSGHPMPSGASISVVDRLLNAKTTVRVGTQESAVPSAIPFFSQVSFSGTEDRIDNSVSGIVNNSNDCLLVFGDPQYEVPLAVIGPLAVISTADGAFAGDNDQYSSAYTKEPSQRLFGAENDLTRADAVPIDQVRRLSPPRPDVSPLQSN